MELCKLRRGLLCCLGVGVIFGVALYLKAGRWYVVPVLHTTADELPVKKVYILTQTYGGQLTRAMRNMMLQQCWAGLNEGNYISVTEPFSSGSQLLHTPQIWNDFQKGQLYTATKFGNYYELSYYNKQSSINKLALLNSWEDFLKHAPRIAIAVSIPTHSCHSGDILQECTFTKPFQSFLNALVDMGFNVIKRVCISCSDLKVPYSLKDFANLLFDNGSEVSIFISGDFLV